MANLTEKELSALQDLLSAEELNVKKFNLLSDAASDPLLKQKFSAIAQQHQRHYTTLYSHLN